MPERSDQEKPFLTIQGVAELLDLDYKTVYRMVVSGQLPAARIGGVYRIRRQDVDAFFRAAQGGPSRLRKSPPGAGAPGCARCGRAFRVPSLVAGRCQTEGCEEPLCVRCWSKRDDRFCREHAKG
jgi:excisionase family DNA binding protein